MPGPCIQRHHKELWHLGQAGAAHPLAGDPIPGRPRGSGQVPPIYEARGRVGDCLLVLAELVTGA